MDNTELFETRPVKSAVITLAIPTVISQLINVVYNMADTYFIGQLNDPKQVAAATVAMPPFIFLTGIANLMGIGGASLISRDMGKGNTERIRQCSAFAVWGAAGIAFLYGLMFMFFRPVILPLIGTTQETYEDCYRYVVWTVTVGAIPTVVSVVLSHLVRTEGYAKQASMGLTLGGIMNMILDPVFIFGFHMQIQGAAIATMLSNCISLVYFAGLLYKKRGSTLLRVSPVYFSLGKGVPREVIMVGLPSFIMVFMSFLSNTTLNHLVALYSSEAIAGMGIAKKVDMIGFAVAQGMTQGVLALIGYNYASGNWKRMKQAIQTTLLYSVSIAAAGSVILFVFATPISRLFIQNEETVRLGQAFIRTLCISLPTSSVTMMIITVFQATGKKVQPMLLSLLRKGGLDIPFMVLLHLSVGILGIAWATPIADVLTMSIAIATIVPVWKKIKGSRA